MQHIHACVTTAWVPGQLLHLVPCIEAGRGHLPLARRDMVEESEADAILVLLRLDFVLDR